MIWDDASLGESWDGLAGVGALVTKGDTERPQTRRRLQALVGPPAGARPRAKRGRAGLLHYFVA
jgi:hypothetical protein